MFTLLLEDGIRGGLGILDSIEVVMIGTSCDAVAKLEGFAEDFMGVER